MKRLLRNKTYIEIIAIIFIILIIYLSYTMVTSKDIKCYWTTKGIICGGKLGE